MRSVFAIAALLLALLFAAAPAEAVSITGDDSAFASAAPQDSLNAMAAAIGGHCSHVPCPNTGHNHLPGGCTGHSFVSTAAFETPLMFAADARVAVEHEDASERNLLPPVPPPLA